MTSTLFILISFVRTFYLTAAFERSYAPRLGENCRDDFHCQQRDSNTICPTHKDQRYQLRYICTCKFNYHVEIINNTEKCMYGELPEEEKEGLTAAPIILCFMGCVIIEAFCLLSFRHWKKHRRADFTQHHTLNLEAFQLADTRIPLPARNRAFVSFMITSEVDNTLSGTGASSPPPYSQAGIVSSSSTQVEEPPPTYEEAMKHLHCSGTQSNTDISKKCSTRKMSC